jgi:hypothetical protein
MSEVLGAIKVIVEVAFGLFLGIAGSTWLFRTAAGEWMRHLNARVLESYKSELQETQRVNQEKWVLRREACLEALEVVDAQMAHMQWQMNGAQVTPQRVAVDIAKARAVMNKLILTCEGADVVTLYIRALGLRTPDEPPQTMSPDTIHDLRLAIRAELEFGPDFPFDRRKAWIVSLSGASPETIVTEPVVAESSTRPVARIGVPSIEIEASTNSLREPLSDR